MQIIGHGIDLIACGRIEQMHRRHGDRFLRRVFTRTERDYCQRRKGGVESLAGRFAAKEAVLKALGIGWRGGVAWTDVEVTNDPSGRPQVQLHAYTADYARKLGVGRILISISHADGYATASAIAIKE